ncbi:MAG: 4-hydroxy-3-methylbut-2-enyl diphosphate reductase [Planctomycetota bacterium]|nr:4-hydroxy-3-methylbut-2-enyl diphosphate reductase [Planctomycetota bacterium]
MGQDLPATGGEEVVLANPRGFCAGVDRAIQIVERALEVHGAPVFVLHEIVHNKHVLERLRSLGARFVASLEEVPEGSVTVFSAHGVSDAVVDAAAGRHLEVIDATCPLVTKVHRQAIRYEDQGREVILVGHPGHPEVEGTRGRIKGKVHVLSTPEEVAALEVDDADHLAYVTQTTLSVDDTRDVIDALLSRFPAIQGPALKDICYATQNRQTAVKDMIGEVDVLIVVGSENSSNSNRLRELGERGGLPAYLVDRPEQVQPEWVEGATTVGVTAGASAPEELVQLILDRLDELGVARTRELDGEKETVVFQMPEGL